MPRFHWVCTSSGSQCSLAGFDALARKNARYGWRKLDLCARWASVAPTRAVDNTTGPWKCSLYPVQDETLKSNNSCAGIESSRFKMCSPFRKTEALAEDPSESGSGSVALMEMLQRYFRQIARHPCLKHGDLRDSGGGLDCAIVSLWAKNPTEAAPWWSGSARRGPCHPRTQTFDTAQRPGNQNPF